MSDRMFDDWKFSTLNIELGRVTRVRMHRPEVFNAFDETMIAELARVFRRLRTESSVRVVVLEGSGKAFSAGADLQWMQRASTASEDDNLADARRFADMLHSLAELRQPTLARVQGAALGGGVGLVCACDLAVASEVASFAVSEAKFGILPSVIGPYLTRAVGPRQALRLALSTQRIRAAEALALGLVQQVVPAEELDAAVESQVSALLQGGPQAQAEIKALYAGWGSGPITAEDRERSAQTIARVRSTGEAREGFAAFLDKRPAAWIAQGEGPPAAGHPSSP